VKIGIDTTFLVEASIREHPGHAPARAEMRRRLQAGDVFIMAPQILAEFVHVVTDTRRFETPLTVAEALAKARAWWNGMETEHVSPNLESVTQFWEWMSTFALGRKRLLDTMLAATYFSHGVHTILSSNARDYTTFGCFDVIVPGNDRVCRRKRSHRNESAP
jgi:predicted nucleic acid-binding protein